MTAHRGATCVILLALGALGPTLASAAASEVARYLARSGEDVRPMPLSPDDAGRGAGQLDALREWDRVAVESIAKAVTSGEHLREAAALFEGLIRTGPLAGLPADSPLTLDDATQKRIPRFLDAAARLS
jgi:hypothetical protein